MYKNRGANWYRVRFGGFESRESAQSAAKKAGYNQAWIDKIE
jgi:cell division protein FtsN